MIYLWLKYLHVFCVGLSALHFVSRGLMDWRGIPWRSKPLWRVLPHINDTALLLSGAALAWLTHQYPFVVDWLSVKFFLLIIYITLGSFALRQSLVPASRLLAGLGAMSVMALLVTAAVVKPVFAW